MRKYVFHACAGFTICDALHQVEQRRRERAKECFDEIRRMLPAEFDIKPDKNSILLAVIKHIEDLRLQVTPPPPLKSSAQPPHHLPPPSPPPACIHRSACLHGNVTEPAHRVPHNTKFFQ